ncbi:hypothetical protein [Microlunatus sagamiharensis]|nr:hypothetical protein [Microlunatus sagamiharensis]
MQPIRSLNDVLDDAAFLSTERQRRLGDLLGRAAGTPSAGTSTSRPAG